VTDFSDGHSAHDSGVCAAGKVMSALLGLLPDATQRIVRGAGVAISASAQFAMPRPRSPDLHTIQSSSSATPVALSTISDQYFIFAATQLVPQVGKLLNVKGREVRLLSGCTNMGRVHRR
jgi:hypothetical protein